jgi:LuxR family maltose regulon positive regulatory protein
MPSIVGARNDLFPFTDSLITRPQLLAQLNRARTQRLTLIIAPAGYGKSTVLGEWLNAQAEQTDRVWHTLSDADNDPSHLLTRLITNLRSALPDSAVLPVIDGTQASLSYPLSLVFRRAAEVTRREWLLVLDDYHVITNPAIHQALDTLLNLPDGPAHLVIASRTLPPLTTIARLRVEGRLVKLDEQNLRFTSAEAAALFEASDLHWDAPALDRVTERTEGWAAARRLICRASQRESEADPAIILNRMDHESHLFDYLAGQVLNQQPAEVRQFMGRTALLPYLSVELCNAFLDSTDAGAILNTLERSHLFLVRLTEGTGDRYRYHALFQEFLCRCLEETEGVAAVRNWHRRAAQCLLVSPTTSNTSIYMDERIAAIQHLLAAQDWEAAAEVFEVIADWLVDQRQLALMQAWFDRLPQAMTSTRPRLLLAYSMLLDRQAHWSEALAALAQAEQRMTANDAVPDRVLILCRQGWIHFRQGHYAQAKDCGHRALSLLSDKEVQGPPRLLKALSAAYNLLGSCYAETDDIDRGYFYKLRGLRISEALGDRISQAKAFHNIAMNIHFAQGRLADVFEFEHRALRIYNDMSSYLACGALCGLGYVHLARGESDQARVVIERLLQLADTHQDAYQRGYALTQLGHLQREQVAFQ